MSRVSVVIPLFNKGNYIRRTLTSVARQTFNDYEVIVVDDGSQDQGPEIVAAFVDPRVRLIRQANAGPAHARNRGLAEATGRYITFLDADDEWFPDFLATTVNQLDRSPENVQAVSTGYLEYPSGTSAEPLWRKRGLREGVLSFSPNTSPGLAVSALAYMSPWNTLLRTQTVRDFGGFCAHGKSLYGEDSFFWTKLMLNGSLHALMQPLAAYHTECSNLATHRKRLRPVEPMLLYPQDLYAVCRRALKPLLDSILSIRAAKTALMLSYFGKWREARRLLAQFCPASTWMLPKVAMAQAAATPVGSAVGWACQKAIGYAHST